uniref:THAP-type domain-containing protein n=1 Tax=Caenorhabditis japonica TaxID=281687 RepID=A0A8R1HS17_CAEJA
MCSLGIPYESVKNPAFEELVRYLKPDCTIPTPKLLELNTGKLSYSVRKGLFSRSIGPLSVTFDVFSRADEKYLAFSIHYFTDFSSRKNVVFLRKLLLSEIDAESILTSLRRAVSTLNHVKVMFTNMVMPSVEMAGLFSQIDATKRSSICFYHYISEFVEKLLEIDEFEDSVEQLQNFVAKIRAEPDLYRKFRRIQFSKNGELDLPSIDKECWQSKTMFLTRCLLLHNTFTDLSIRNYGRGYITYTTFELLAGLQKIMFHCTRCSRDVSTANSSISQVIPAIMSIRNFIAQLPNANAVDKSIRDIFTTTFSPLTSGLLGQRFEMAMLLDARFAYREGLYARSGWFGIEKNVANSMNITTDSHSDNVYGEESKLLSKSEKWRIASAEFKKYRRMCTTDPGCTRNPFVWWSIRRTELPHLFDVAREYLACPAVSIDSRYFFGEGGKYSHLCHIYNYDQLEICLNIAGHCQEFRGRGFGEQCMSPHLIDRLNDYVVREGRMMTREKEIAQSTGAWHSSPSNVPYFVPSQKRILDDPIEKTPAKLKRYSIQTTLPQSSEKSSSEQKIKHIFQEPISEIKPELFDDVKLEPPDYENESYKMALSSKPIDSCNDYSPKEKRESSNRRCLLCDQIVSQDDLKNCRIDSERCYLVAGAVLSCKIKMDTAKAIFERSNDTYVCRVHFKETCEAFLKSLEIDHEGKTLIFSQHMMEKFMKITKWISGRDVEISESKILIAQFFTKYNRTAEKIDASKFSQHETATAQSEVKPKKIRAPRKQVLEDVTGNDTMVKLIELEPFKLPDLSLVMQEGTEEYEEKEENVDEEHTKNQKMGTETCSFCGIRGERVKMLRVPRSWEKRAIWIDKIGSEFEERLNANGESYVCRSHFSEHSFGRRGRLLRGELPEVTSEKVEVTYRVDGSKFLKLGEQRIKTDKTSSIDLAK